MSVSWSGGGSSDSDTVRIIAFGATASGTAPVALGTAAAKAGSFTVPGSIPGQFANDLGGSGALILYNVAQPISFSAPLAAGGSLDSAVISMAVIEAFTGVMIR